MAAEAPAEFEVYPENHATVRLFLRVATQWRTRGESVLGLDYTAVEAALRLSGATCDPDTFAGLQVMERAVLAHLGEKRG